jgi:RNA polymerase sigma factor (sigma-70 family)
VDDSFNQMVFEDDFDQMMLRKYVVTNDHNSYAYLYNKHYKMVLGVCSSILNDHSIAEDTAQEVFLGLLSWAKNINGSVRAYLLRVATNLSYRISRHRSSRRETQLEIFEEWGSSSRSNHEARLEFMELLQKALARMSVKERTVIEQIIMDQCLTSSDLGKILGTSAGGARGYLSLARAALSDSLGRSEIEVTERLVLCCALTEREVTSSFESLRAHMLIIAALGA